MIRQRARARESVAKYAPNRGKINERDGGTHVGKAPLQSFTGSIAKLSMKIQEKTRSKAS